MRENSLAHILLKEAKAFFPLRIGYLFAPTFPALTPATDGLVALLPLAQNRLHRSPPYVLPTKKDTTAIFMLEYSLILITFSMSMIDVMHLH